MALTAEVVSAEAVVLSDRAAEVALPVDLLFTVSWAVAHASTCIALDLALAATIVLFVCALIVSKLLLAVSHSSEVGLLAIEAFVESAGVKS